MPLPNRNNLDSLDYVYQGQPFVQVEAKTSFSIKTKKLDIVYRGQPFVAASPPPSSNVYANVNGTWKQASQLYINVNGVWKDIEDDLIYVKIGSSWRP